MLRDKLLSMYDLFPFHEHPLWRAVRGGKLSHEQVIKAELQHWFRTRTGQSLRRAALDAAQKISPAIFELLLETYLEECTNEKGSSHLELIERLVIGGGFPAEQLPHVRPTPGNSAAIALYRDIGRRGAGCHMLGAGAVEFYYCRLSPAIFEAYTSIYGMTEFQAETYKVHGAMDYTHAERAFAVLDEAVALHGQQSVEDAVRDAFVATSLHYDGMLQAATEDLSFWNGRLE